MSLVLPNNNKVLTRDMLHGYQDYGVEFIKEHKFCALWLAMGLGKTISTATAVWDLMQDFSVGRTLVVAPKRVALTTWPMELEKWDHLQGLRYQVISGSVADRVRAVMRKADLHIISQDNFNWLVRVVGTQWPWDTVVLDESRSFHSQSSNRWNACRKVRQAGKVDRMIQLTATPAPQGLGDLWGQFYLLDLGQRLGSTEKAFNTRWFNVDRRTGKKLPKEFARDEIFERVSDITVSMAAEDYLDMPELIKNPIYVDLSSQAMKAYRKFERELLLELEDVDAVVDAQNAGILVGKLLQFANGACYYDDQKNFSIIHDEKIQALKEIVDADPGKPILVAYNFISDLKRLKKAFPHAVVMDDDPETQRRWNAGKIQMLVTHPKSSGHGLNLQEGSNVIVWFGLNWSLELYLQLIGRLYRQGQTFSSVIVHHIMARRTVDERVFKALLLNDASQNDLLEAVKAG